MKVIIDGIIKNIDHDESYYVVFAFCLEKWCRISTVNALLPVEMYVVLLVFFIQLINWCFFRGLQEPWMASSLPLLMPFSWVILVVGFRVEIFIQCTIIYIYFDCFWSSLFPCIIYLFSNFQTISIIVAHNVWLSVLAKLSMLLTVVPVAIPLCVISHCVLWVNTSYDYDKVYRVYFYAKWHFPMRRSQTIFLEILIKIRGISRSQKMKNK